MRDADGEEVLFRVKRTTPMKKVMDAFCNRMGTQNGSYRFLFDGDRIEDDYTPESLEMEEMDSIDALVTQTGGNTKF